MFKFIYIYVSFTNTFILIFNKYNLCNNIELIYIIYVEVK